VNAEDTFMWKEIMESPAAIENSMRVNSKAIKELAGEFNRRKIRNIMIAGRGTSDHAAVYGQYILGILCGIPVTFAAPSLLTMYKCNLDLRDWFVIGISQSGQTMDAVSIVDSAAAQGALTAVITNTENSVLAKSSNYTLLCSAGPEKSVAATKTFITEMDLLLQIATAISGNAEAERELREIPDSLDKVFTMNNMIQSLVPRYRFMSECFVLSRGVNYAVALEAALKIQETTYVKALGFAISDFYHGPLAMINSGLPVIVLAPGKNLAAEAGSFLDRISAAHADTLVISDDRELCRKGSVSLQLPVSASDCANAFHTTAVIQMFACRLAVLLENNPDKPRMLKKIADVN